MKNGQLDFGTDKIISDLGTIKNLVNEISAKSETFIKSINPKKTTTTTTKPAKEEATALSKEITRLKNEEAKAIVRLEAAQMAELKATMANTDAKRQATNARKLEIQSTNEGVDAYKRLEAQTKLYVQAALREGAILEELKNKKNTNAQAIMKQNKVYSDAVQTSQKYVASLNTLKRQTGQADMATQGMYGATYSLTQVMRELPNFAIDARIGFMSLSNNLPYLAEQFSATAKSIDATTGKLVGGMGALKQFAKSLLSLNTIMIAVSTIMIMFGDDLVDLIGKLFDATDATDALTIAQKGYNKAMEDAEGRTGQFRKDLIQIKGVLAAVTEGQAVFNEKGEITNLIWKDSKRALSEYEKVRNLLPEESINLIEKDGVVNLKIAAKEIIKLYNNLIIAQGHLQAAEEMSVKIIEKENDLRGKQREIISASKNIDEDKITEEQLEKFNETSIVIDRLTNKFKSLGKSDKEISHIINLIATERVDEKSIFSGTWLDDFVDKVASSGREYEDIKKIFETTPEERDYILYYARNKKGIAELTALQKAYNSELGKSELAIPRTDDKKERGGGGGSARGRRALTDYEAEYFYNHEREKMIERIADLETETERETLNGVLRGFEERRKALQDWRTFKQSLLVSDYEVDIKNEEEATEKRRRALEQKMLENEKYASGDKDYAKNQAELQLALDTLDKNLATKKVERHDKMLADLKGLYLDYQKTALQITEDEYTEDMRLIDEQYKREEFNLTQRQKREEAALEKSARNRESIGRLFGQDFNTTGIERIQNEYYDSQQSLQIEENKLNDKLELTKENSDEYLKLIEQRDEIERKMAEKKNQYLIDLEAEKDRQIIALRDDLINKSEKAVMEGVKALFQQYYNEVERQKERFGIIEDERTKQIEDRARAGVITEEEAEKEKAKINEYYANVQKKLDHDRKEAERKQFLFDQAMALSKVAINTAIGVSEALAKEGEYGIITGVLIAAAGAVQTATIAAQSIPEYEEGTSFAKGGLSLVGEKENEVIFNPDGSIQVTPNKPTFMNVQRGAKIVPSLGELNAIEKEVLFRNIGLEEGYDFTRLERKLDNISIKQTMNINEITLFEKMKYSNKTKGLF
jgi:hypothetical protein